MSDFALAVSACAGSFCRVALSTASADACSSFEWCSVINFLTAISRASSAVCTASRETAISSFLSMCLLDGNTKRCDGNAAKVLRISLQTAQSRSQQRNRTHLVASLRVVEGGGHLNQRLQKRLFRLACHEPDQFPVFVCLEESTGIKAVRSEERRVGKECRS